MKFALDFANVEKQYMVLLLFSHYFPSIANNLIASSIEFKLLQNAIWKVYWSESNT